MNGRDWAGLVSPSSGRVKNYAAAPTGLQGYSSFSDFLGISSNIDITRLIKGSITMYMCV